MPSYMYIEGANYILASYSIDMFAFDFVNKIAIKIY